MSNFTLRLYNIIKKSSINLTADILETKTGISKKDIIPRLIYLCSCNYIKRIRKNNIYFYHLKNKGE